MRHEHLDRNAVETALMMYLKEVRGYTFAQVFAIRFPVFDNRGNAGAVVEVAEKSGGQ